ncbi:MAG: HicB family protein [Verrucomicrobia bacterium 12-59-8]|nr:MAG: HicB family protein [Verrucomicrobia bacterium 12-59-8]
MQFNIETEIESDGRWIAEVLEVPGALAYGITREEAIQRSESLALRVLAEQFEQGTVSSGIANLFRVAA